MRDPFIGGPGPVRTGTPMTRPPTPDRWARAFTLYLITVFLLLTLLGPVPTTGQAHGNRSDAGHDTPPSSRIIVISNETAIPIAEGRPSSGLSPFDGILSNQVAVHITGQVVDGNYTPIWQPGSSDNNPVADVRVHWSFHDEPPRAHTISTGPHGLFTILLTPQMEGPTNTTLRFWFDGKTDGMYGIPVYPATEEVYDVHVAAITSLSIETVPSRASPGDTILVKGTLTDGTGRTVTGEGLMAHFDGSPAQDNPDAGWFIDNVALAHFYEDFEDGTTNFTIGGKGTSWAFGTPGHGPDSCAHSLGCAGTGLSSGYRYTSDTYMISSTIDMTGISSATLSFDTWAEIASGDTIVVEVSNDDGQTWPVVFPVDPAPLWQANTLRIGRFTDTPYGVVDFGDSPSVRIRFRLTGHSMPLATDGDGDYEFLYTVPGGQEAGPAIMKVVHPASTGYGHVSSSAVVDIARPTALSLDVPGTIFRGTPVEISATLLDSEDNSLRTDFPDRPHRTPEVRFWMGSGGSEEYLGSAPVDAHGRAVMDYEPDQDSPLGPLVVRASYGGSDFYLPAGTTADTVLGAHTVLEITVPKDATLLTGEYLTVSGTLSIVRTESVNDVTTDPVTHRTVTIGLNGQEIGRASTGTDGTFTLNRSVAGTGVDLGNAVIEANFQGDLVHRPSTDRVDFSILSETSIRIFADRAYKGSRAVLEGRLDSIDGGVQGVLTVTVGDFLHRKVVSGSDGGFAMAFDVPWDIDVGALEIHAEYGGSDVYRPSSVTTGMGVTAETVILVNGTPLETRRDTGLPIKGRVMEVWGDHEGTPVTGGMIDLLLPDGTRARAPTGHEGYFQHVYDVPVDLEVGEAEIMLTFTGTDRDPSSTIVPVAVVGDTSLSFHRPDLTTEVDRDITLSLTLADDTGAPLPGREVRVYRMEDEERTLMFEGITDPEGGITFVRSFNDTGTVTLLARYEGDGSLDPSQGLTYINVRSVAADDPPLHREPTVVLGGSLSLVILAALLGTESGKYLLFKLLLVPMYSKMKKEDVLDHFVRGQIYGLIRMRPGAHYNLIKKKLDLKNGILSYHLKVLEREGYVISEADGIYKRFFPNHVKFEVDYPVFLTKIQEKILDFVKRTPGSTQKEVARGLDISTSTVNDNIRVLRQTRLLIMKRDGKRTRCFLPGE